MVVADQPFFLPDLCQGLPLGDFQRPGCQVDFQESPPPRSNSSKAVFRSGPACQNPLFLPAMSVQGRFSLGLIASARRCPGLGRIAFLHIFLDFNGHSGSFPFFKNCQIGIIYYSTRSVFYLPCRGRYVVVLNNVVVDYFKIS